MKAQDLQNSTIVQTATVAEATKDPKTLYYVQTCLDLFFSGMYGEVPEEDTEQNNAELEAGEGRIVARYKKEEKLTDDIYIIAYFSESNPGDIDFNNITILYTWEY